MRNSTKIEDTGKKARGRPRDYHPETALRRAAEVFWGTGYSGTSLDAITAATGMSRPSLSAAFGDKHAIYLKALDDYWESKFAAMHEALAAGRTLDKTLISVYDAALSIYFSGEGPARGCFVLGTALTEAFADPEVQSIVAAGFRRLDADFEARFRRARDAGELEEGADIEALAMLAAATMQTIAIRARTGTPRKDLRRLARKAVDVICG
jgi:AcrR family transcriptional regulator